MAKGNLNLLEAAKLRRGDLVIFSPQNITCSSPNPDMMRGLTPGESYKVDRIKPFGFRGESEIPLELKPRNLRRATTITEAYGRPLTNVQLQLEGVEGMRCYCYFSANQGG